MGSRVNQEDRLSNLPGSILVYILSFLPTVDAVRTMLIKKSFVGLWTSLPILDLEDLSFNYSNISDDDNDEKGSSSMRDLPFFNFVRNVLSRHTRPKIVKFRVNIDQVMYYEIEDWNLGHELESWISFALRKQVEVLDFGFGLVEPFFEIYKWPHPEFASDFLVELRLEYVNVDSLTQVKMGLLRILRLVRVEVTDSIFELIICGCPLLEVVQIYNCDLCMLNLSTVKKLILDVNELSFYSTEDDNFQQVVKINGPNLRSFDFAGHVDYLELMDLSSLVEITCNLDSERKEFKEFHKFITVLKTFICAESVSFSCEFVMILFYCMLKDLARVSAKWKRVKLTIWLTEKHIHGLDCMLRNSPHIEELEIDITTRTPDFIQHIESELSNDVLDAEDCWRSLKSITIHSIANSSYTVLVHLSALILQKALVLNELVFYYKGKDQSAEGACNMKLEELPKFSQQLSTLPTASQHVNILLH